MKIHLIRNAEFDSSNSSRSDKTRWWLEKFLQLRQEIGRIDKGKFAQTLGDNVARTFFMAFAVSL